LLRSLARNLGVCWVFTRSFSSRRVRVTVEKGLFQWDPKGEAMSTAGHFTEHPQMLLSGSDARWYAVQTRSRHERVVAAQLREQDVSIFLPMITQIRRWSDRRKLVEFPLFSGYVFVHAAVSPQIRRIVL